MHVSTQQGLRVPAIKCHRGDGLPLRTRCSFACPRLHGRCRPYLPKLQRGAQQAPPTAWAAPSPLTFLRLPPGWLRCRGAGNSLSFRVQLPQYTVALSCARNQRLPHPSHIFKCTRKYIMISPRSVLHSAVLCLLTFLQKNGSSRLLAGFFVALLPKSAMLPFMLFSSSYADVLPAGLLLRPAPGSPSVTLSSPPPCTADSPGSGKADSALTRTATRCQGRL